jgi:hypothetical protein
LGDLFELLDGVSFRSTLTTSSNALARVSQHPTIESIDNYKMVIYFGVVSHVVSFSSAPCICRMFMATCWHYSAAESLYCVVLRCGVCCCYVWLFLTGHWLR